MYSQRARKLAIRILKHIIKRQLQRIFTTWQARNRAWSPVKNIKLTIPPRSTMKLLVNTDRTRTPRKEQNSSRSPIEASNRLYNNAKEIQEKKSC